MPCDGKNPNCDRRRELLAQLKCLISSMDRKKPCEWDEPPCPPVVCCPTEPPLCTPPPFCGPIKPCKSVDFRASIMYRCECIKRNGLQDRCKMWDCMGRPECMTKLYPICGPGRAALLKLTDLGDVEVALRKFFCADQAREAALAAYCRLVCDNTRQKQAQLCTKNSCAEIPCIPPECPMLQCPPRNINACNGNNNNFSKDPCCSPPPPCCDPPSYCVYIPSPAYPICIPQPCCTPCPPRNLRKTLPPCDPPPPLMCLPFCEPVCLPSVQCCPVT